MEHILEDWDADRRLLNEYHWQYKMKPHLSKVQKLQEKALRSIVTSIANSTRIKGRPLIDVFPEVEKLMMDNFNPNSPTLIEKYGLFNLQGLNLEEWFAADWEKFSDCVEEHGYTEKAYRETCNYYDTYDNAFEKCAFEGNCELYGVFMDNYPLGSVPSDEGTG